jgi:hypothetical protein
VLVEPDWPVLAALALPVLVEPDWPVLAALALPVLVEPDWPVLAALAPLVSVEPDWPASVEPAHTETPRPLPADPASRPSAPAAAPPPVS